MRDSESGLDHQAVADWMLDSSLDAPAEVSDVKEEGCEMGRKWFCEPWAFTEDGPVGEAIGAAVETGGRTVGTLAGRIPLADFGRWDEPDCRHWFYRLISPNPKQNKDGRIGEICVHDPRSGLLTYSVFPVYPE